MPCREQGPHLCPALEGAPRGGTSTPVRLSSSEHMEGSGNWQAGGGQRTAPGREEAGETGRKQRAFIEPGPFLRTLPGPCQGPCEVGAPTAPLQMRKLRQREGCCWLRVEWGAGPFSEPASHLPCGKWWARAPSPLCRWPGAWSAGRGRAASWGARKEVQRLDEPGSLRPCPTRRPQPT